MKIQILVRASLATSLVLLAGSASAATVSINVSSQLSTGTVISGSGAGVIGSAITDTWNTVDADGMAAGTGSGAAIDKILSTVVDVDNGATAYGVTFSGLRAHAGAGGNNSPTGISPWTNSWFADNRNPGNNDQTSITISGFTAGDVVDVVVFNNYHFPSSSFTRGQTYTINGSPVQSTTGQDTTPTAYSAGVNYLSFDDILVNGNSEIVISAGGSLFTDFAGLQFSVVPEPSVGILGALSALVLLRRRRS